MRLEGGGPQRWLHGLDGASPAAAWPPQKGRQGAAVSQPASQPGLPTRRGCCRQRVPGKQSWCASPTPSPRGPLIPDNMHSGSSSGSSCYCAKESWVQAGEVLQHRQMEVSGMGLGGLQLGRSPPEVDAWDHPLPPPNATAIIVDLFIITSFKQLSRMCRTHSSGIEPVLRMQSLAPAERISNRNETLKDCSQSV